MKKPNITYKEIECSHSEVIIDGGTVIIDGRELFEDDCADLISEMIDALIEAHGYVQTKINIFKEQYPNDIPENAINKLNKIEQALKKAGCE